MVVLAALPGLTLLMRGVVWGSDSFGFWAVSCGRSEFAHLLGSPDWFVWFLQNIISCNLYLLALSMFFLYFFALLGIFQIGKQLFGVKGWVLPILVGSLTPLFFLEAIRLENDFFSWALMFVCVGLLCLFVENVNKKRAFGLFSLVCLWLSIPLALMSIDLWVSSGILLFIPFLLLDFWKGKEEVRDFLVVLVFFVVIVWQLPNMLLVFMHGSLIGEDIPLLGLVFVLHILHFYKRIPQPFFIYGLCLLVVGALKAKFMFLAVPFLLMGLLDKELKEGLSIPKLGIEKIPVFAFCWLFAVGWVFMGLSAYPQQSDLTEMQEAIKLANDQNQFLYNDWGDGWMLISLGYDVNYFMSPAYPYQSYLYLKRPFVAWSLEDIVGCERISKRTQQCN